MSRVLVFSVFMFLLCSFAFAVTSDDLVLYMSFDSKTISGNTVKDLSKYGNNGTIKGAPKVVAGKNGDALDFNGSSDCVEIPTSPSLAKTADQITLSAWVFSRKDAQVDIISKWDGNLNGMIHFELQAGGVIRFCIRKAVDAADATIVDLKAAAGSLSLNKWTYVTQTYDGTTARIYVDGVEVLNGAGAGNIRDTKDVKYWIGSMYATDRWFGGLLDDVQIWSKALTVDEIKASMDGKLLTVSAINKEDKLATTWGSLKK